MGDVTLSIVIIAALIWIFTPKPNKSKRDSFPIQTEVGDYNSHLAFLEMHGAISEEEAMEMFYLNNPKERIARDARHNVYGEEAGIDMLKRLFGQLPHTQEYHDEIKRLTELHEERESKMVTMTLQELLDKEQK